MQSVERRVAERLCERLSTVAGRYFNIVDELDLDGFAAFKPYLESSLLTSPTDVQLWRTYLRYCAKWLVAAPHPMCWGKWTAEATEAEAQDSDLMELIAARDRENGMDAVEVRKAYSKEQWPREQWRVSLNPLERRSYPLLLTDSALYRDLLKRTQLAAGELFQARALRVSEKCDFANITDRYRVYHELVSEYMQEYQFSFDKELSADWYPVFSRNVTPTWCVALSLEENVKKPWPSNLNMPNQSNCRIFFTIRHRSLKSPLASGVSNYLDRDFKGRLLHIRYNAMFPGFEQVYCSTVSTAPLMIVSIQAQLTLLRIVLRDFDWDWLGETLKS